MNMEQSGPILLFDGACNFCNGFVNFIVRYDRQAKFRFASLQSEAGRSLLQKYGLADLPLSTSVLIEGDRALLNSDGVLRAAHLLGGVFGWLAPLRAVPRPLRDVAYKAFARNRYRLFGQADQCLVPTPELRRRFLDLA